MTTAEYTIRLDAFEGPLDLLLFLIRRAEVEITDIPIARITEQYLSFLDDFTRSARPIDIENAGEFLVMAATLVEIKSRMLAPPARSQTAEADHAPDAEVHQPRKDDPGDPRTALVRQLLEYKRFRDAAEHLEHWRTEYTHRYEAARAPAMQPDPDQAAPEEEPLVEVEDLHLIDLVEAFARIMQSVDFSRVGEHRVVFDDTPVEVHAEDILDQLRRLAFTGSPDSPGPTPTPSTTAKPHLLFAELFVGRTRSEAIGLFLAMLELVKQRKVLVRHEQADDPTLITLELAEPDAPDAPESPEVPSASAAPADATADLAATPTAAATAAGDAAGAV